MGWSGVKNGKLLVLAASDFDAFITVDKNLPYQQNVTELPIAIVVLDAVSSELPALLSLVPNSNANLLRSYQGHVSVSKPEMGSNDSIQRANSNTKVYGVIF